MTTTPTNTTPGTGGLFPDDLFADFEDPTPTVTESDVNTRMSTPPASTPDKAPPADPGEGGYTRPRVGAREDADVNTPETDTTDTPEGDVNTAEVDNPDTDSDRPGVVQRAQEAAQKWGLDVRPPSFAREGLPPLNHSRSYAQRGEQAANIGPARTAARLWDFSTRPVRWMLRLTDHLLARPGRFLVALALLALLARIEAFRFLVALTVALVDLITFYTGLQWLLGLV